MTYATEFPGFALPDGFAAPAGFVDVSWKNDACPSWLDETRGLRLWVDHADPFARDFTGRPRFALCWESNGCDYATSNEWADILAAVDHFDASGARNGFSEEA